MRQFNVIFIFVAISWSCKNPTGQIATAHNDTSVLLNQALSEAIAVRFMPDADAVKRPYLFKDSILLTSKAIPLALLPTSVGVHKFKIMPEQEILSVLRKDSNNLNLPNYLIISRLEAIDSGYYVQVQNLSALPFGGGGSLGIYSVKKGDSIIHVKRSASSIN